MVDCYHVFNKVIIKKVCIKFVSGVKTIFAVLKFNNPLGSDSFCELKTSVGSVAVFDLNNKMTTKNDKTNIINEKL